MVSILSTCSEEVYHYWNSLRRMRSAPLRSEFDPGAVRRHLQDLFMLDWQQTELHFRLAGTRICDAFAEEFLGKPFASLWRSASHRSVLEAALSALRTEEAMLLDLTADNEETSFAFEMLLMPMRGSPRFADRLLGSLSPLQPLSGAHPLMAGTLQLDRWQPVAAIVDDPDRPTARSAMARDPIALTRRFLHTGTPIRRPL